jgi:hypothetical protein
MRWCVHCGGGLPVAGVAVLVELSPRGSAHASARTCKSGVCLHAMSSHQLAVRPQPACLVGTQEGREGGQPREAENQDAQAREESAEGQRVQEKVMRRLACCVARRLPIMVASTPLH